LGDDVFLRDAETMASAEQCRDLCGVWPALAGGPRAETGSPMT
jgi:hypothetical protein